jgi:hypothetical protein
MRAGLIPGFLFLAAMIGCEQPTATSQRVPGPPPSEGAAPDTAPEYGDSPQYAAPASADASQQFQSTEPPPSAAPALPSNVPSALNNIPGVNAAEAPSSATPQQPATQLPAEQPIREKAEAGVGVRGDRIQSGGIYTTPAKAYFQVRERLTFLQVDQALQLFRGLEGRLPQSHDEFMQKVIQANQIQLPELPPGSRYVWDPQKGELMVERPQ